MRQIAGQLLAILAISAVMVAGAGCAGGKGQYNSTTGVYDTTKQADQFVVAAQQVRSIALEVFDSFMKLERQNETALAKISPDIHKAADEIRRNGKTWLDDLSKAIAAYQSDRAEGAKTKVVQALAVVQSALHSAQDYIAQNTKR